MTDRIAIKEEDHIHDEWYKQAKDMTVQDLPEFIRRLTEDYGHDYGTICHAIAAAALAAAHAINHGPMGGITGFQAGCIMWEFITKWMSYENQPMRLTRYDEMLYPQYAHNFNQISKETHDWLIKEAKKHIEAHKDDLSSVHPEVLSHWNAVASGWIPFGYAEEQAK